MMAARSNGTQITRAVQWLLAYKPWLGGDSARSYREAIERPSDPIPALPEDLMPLYRITEPVLSDSEFLKLVRKRKLQWLDIFGSETLDLSGEEENG